MTMQRNTQGTFDTKLFAVSLRRVISVWFVRFNFPVVSKLSAPGRFGIRSTGRPPRAMTFCPLLLGKIWLNSFIRLHLYQSPRSDTLSHLPGFTTK